MARQRNQGIALATADILFLIDDDSLMYPGCAGRIMAIYEADRDGAVAGVQATLAAAPPGDLEVADGRKKTGYGAVPEVRGGRLRTVKEALWRHLFLMDAPTLFIPYDGAYPRRPLPSAIARLGVVREGPAARLPHDLPPKGRDAGAVRGTPALLLPGRGPRPQLPGIAPRAPAHRRGRHPPPSPDRVGTHRPLQGHPPLRPQPGRPAAGCTRTTWRSVAAATGH